MRPFHLLVLDLSMKKLIAALVAFSFATGSFACAVGHAGVTGDLGAKPAARAKAPQKKRAAKPVKPQATMLERQAEAAAAL
jgi:hypothetical protein